MNEDYLKQLQSNVQRAKSRTNCVLRKDIPNDAYDMVAKPNKYRNVITEVDGVKFDSKGEAKRFEFLCRLEAIGEISDLQRQVPFKLMCNGECVAKYEADFTYTICANGRKVIEDFKKDATRTPVYRLKAKIMATMGYKISEVGSPERPAGWSDRDKVH